MHGPEARLMRKASKLGNKTRPNKPHSSQGRKPLAFSPIGSKCMRQGVRKNARSTTRSTMGIYIHKLKRFINACFSSTKTYIAEICNKQLAAA